MGAVFAIVLSTSLAVFLMILIVFCCRHARKNKKKDRIVDKERLLDSEHNPSILARERWMRGSNKKPGRKTVSFRDLRETFREQPSHQDRKGSMVELERMYRDNDNVRASQLSRQSSVSRQREHDIHRPESRYKSFDDLVLGYGTKKQHSKLNMKNSRSGLINDKLQRRSNPNIPEGTIANGHKWQNYKRNTEANTERSSSRHFDLRKDQQHEDNMKRVQRPRSVREIVESVKQRHDNERKIFPSTSNQYQHRNTVPSNQRITPGELDDADDDGSLSISPNVLHSPPSPVKCEAPDISSTPALTFNYTASPSCLPASTGIETTSKEAKFVLPRMLSKTQATPSSHRSDIVTSQPGYTARENSQPNNETSTKIVDKKVPVFYPTSSTPKNQQKRQSVAQQIRDIKQHEMERISLTNMATSHGHNSEQAVLLSSPCVISSTQISPIMSGSPPYNRDIVVRSNTVHHSSQNGYDSSKPSVTVCKDDQSKQQNQPDDGQNKSEYVQLSGEKEKLRVTSSKLYSMRNVHPPRRPSKKHSHRMNSTVTTADIPTSFHQHISTPEPITDMMSPSLEQLPVAPSIPDYSELQTPRSQINKQVAQQSQPISRTPKTVETRPASVSNYQYHHPPPTTRTAPQKPQPPPAPPIHTLPKSQPPPAPPIHTLPKSQPPPAPPIHTLPKSQPPPAPPIHTLPKSQPPPAPPIHTLPKSQPPPAPPIHTLPKSQPPPAPPIHTLPKSQPPPAPPIHTLPKSQPPPAPPIHTLPKSQPPPAPPIHTLPKSQPPPAPPIHTLPKSQPPPAPPIHTLPKSQPPPAPPIHTLPKSQVPPVPPLHTLPKPLTPPASPLHSSPQTRTVPTLYSSHRPKPPPKPQMQAAIPPPPPPPMQAAISFSSPPSPTLMQVATPTPPMHTAIPAPPPPPPMKAAIPAPPPPPPIKATIPAPPPPPPIKATIPAPPPPPPMKAAIPAPPPPPPIKATIPAPPPPPPIKATIPAPPPPPPMQTAVPHPPPPPPMQTAIPKPPTPPMVPNISTPLMHTTVTPRLNSAIPTPPQPPQLPVSLPPVSSPVDGGKPNRIHNTSPIYSPQPYRGGGSIRRHVQSPDNKNTSTKHDQPSSKTLSLSDSLVKTRQVDKYIDNTNNVSESDFNPGETSTPQQSTTAMGAVRSGDTESPLSTLELVQAHLKKRRRQIMDSTLDASQLLLDASDSDQSLSPIRKSISEDKTIDHEQTDSNLALKSRSSIILCEYDKALHGDLSKKIADTKHIRHDPDVQALLSDIKKRRQSYSKFS